VQEERFEVVRGIMRFKRGRETVVAGPGETAQHARFVACSPVHSAQAVTGLAMTGLAMTGLAMTGVTRTARREKTAAEATATAWKR
jgi:hypothetical protein